MNEHQKTMLDLAVTRYGNKCYYSFRPNNTKCAVYVTLDNECIADYWYANGKIEHIEYRAPDYV
jgi:hypothetical protein